MSERLTERDDRWIVDLAGSEVNWIGIDFRFSLQLTFPFGSARDGELATVVAESPFDFSPHGSYRQRFVPEEPTGLGPALALLHRKVEDVTVWKDGRLEVAFTGGDRLEIDPDPSYEAWQLIGAGVMFVCTPGGGEPALWLGERRPASPEDFGKPSS